MENRFWAIIGILAVLFVGVLWVSSNKKDDTKQADTTAASQHIKGDPVSKVRLVEYGDFECPVCGVYYPVVAQILEKHGDKIAFQFRHLPLSQVHRNAFAAARSAEAASAQGKFWEMYDLLFQNQTIWSQAQTPTETFKQYASQLGLDMTKYETYFKSEGTNKTINADIAAFKQTGAQMATPTFFLNGKKIDLKTLAGSDGQPSVDKFSKYIEDELAKQGQ